MRPLLLVLAALLLFAPSASSRYSAYGTEQDDYASFRALLRSMGDGTASLIASPDALPGTGPPIVLVVASERAPTEEEDRRLGAFLARGGSVWLLTRSDGWEELTRPVGLLVLRDTVVSAIGDRAEGDVPSRGLVAGASIDLVSHAPAPLRLLDGFGGQIVMESNGTAFLASLNSTIGAENEAARFPLGAVATLPGGGHLLVMGDPDLLSDAYLERGERSSRQFWAKIRDRFVPQGALFVFDERDRLEGVRERVSASAAGWGIANGVPSAAGIAAVGLALAAVAASARVFGGPPDGEGGPRVEVRRRPGSP